MMLRLLVWTLVLIGVWLLLAGPEPTAWVIGVPTIGLAVLAALFLAPETAFTIRPLAAVRFLPYFVFHSMRGGWDVAVRALHPDLPIHPERMTYNCTLPSGTPRVVFANLVSLMPGTLFVNDQGMVVELHAVDRHQPVLAEVAVLEERVRELFGLPAGNTP